MYKEKKGTVRDYDFAFVVERRRNHVGVGISYTHNTPTHRPFGIPTEFPRTRGIEIAFFIYSIVLTWHRHIES
jgi:hypothetical protein